MPPPGVCANILQSRHKKDGKGSLSSPDNFLYQDFSRIKQYCIAKGFRYIDDMFPPDRTSIGQGILSPRDLSRVVWLRPAKMVVDPAFIVDGVSRFDFGQGIVGNCWFLASIGALTFQKHILAQVVPVGQMFDEEYCGVFHFRFWRFGRWVDVVIDDKLPTIEGRLIFVRSKTPNEFWPPLLEKAYAKVCGSYADMNAGTPAEALMDFTGGVHIEVRLNDPPPDLWDLMLSAASAKSLMGCATPQGETSANTVAPSGLVRGHAYTVTGVKQMVSCGKIVRLVRLWNPWGKGEWNGDWSDRSSLWRTVSQREEELCHTVKDDGEFWMAIEDFCEHFEDVDICSTCPDFLDSASTCHWSSSVHEGRWVAGVTAGGCMNHIESFWTNPQYQLRIDDLHGHCAGQQNDKNLLVSLMQKPNKRNRRLMENHHIGFSVFEVPENHKKQRGKFPASFFRDHQPVAQTKSYLNTRDVTAFFKLRPGEFLIVPSTFKPNDTASFILTIISKTQILVHENSTDDDNTDDKTTTVMHSHKENNNDDETEKLFLQYSDKYEEMTAEQLHGLLNEQFLKSHSKSQGFSLDACRSMVALMDSSVSGKLNASEFLSLWRKITTFKNTFFCKDVSQTGTLSLGELRNAITDSGLKVNDEMLNLMAVRYGASSGHMTLESFISLILRLESMYQIFKQLSKGNTMTLGESEWMYISMYT